LSHYVPHEDQAGSIWAIVRNLDNGLHK
jgi:hypothetical protein